MFINYGRMQSLNRFYPDKDALPEATRNLLHVMQDLSDSVQLCDMSWFENILPELADTLTAFKNSDEEKGYLGSFRDLIVHGYTPMIQYNTETHAYEPHNDALTLIQWFRDKGLYQQMLTICESATTRYLYAHKIVRYDAFIRYTGKKNKGNYELYNWLFNNIITACKAGTNIKDGPYFDRNMIYPATKIINAYFTLDQDAAALREFLQIHFTLKMLRNHSNHGSQAPEKTIGSDEGTQSPIADLLAMIDRYLELMVQLADWNENPDPNRTEQTYIMVTGVKCQESDMRLDEIFAISDAKRDLGYYLQDHRNVEELEEFPEKFQNIHPVLRELYEVVYHIAQISDLDRRVAYVEKSVPQHVVDLMRKVYEDKGECTLEFMLKDGYGNDPRLPFHITLGKKLTNMPLKDAYWLGQITNKPYHDDGRPKYYEKAKEEGLKAAAAEKEAAAQKDAAPAPTTPAAADAVTASATNTQA